MVGPGHFSLIGGLESALWKSVDEIGRDYRDLGTVKRAALRLVVQSWLSSEPADAIEGAPRLEHGIMTGIDVILCESFLERIRGAARRIELSPGRCAFDFACPLMDAGDAVEMK